VDHDNRGFHSVLDEGQIAARRRHASGSKQDWINNCTEEAKVHLLVVDAIEKVMWLI
jgi:hypothetical protein